MQGRHLANKIAEYRQSGELDKAIGQARVGIGEFPELNFFYKILGDLLWDKGDYLEAGKAYIDFLERIKEETQYFKNFVKFWNKFKKRVDEDTKRCIYNEIVKKFNQNAFSMDLKREISALLFETNTQEDEEFQSLGTGLKKVRDWIKEKEQRNQLWSIYQMLFWKDYNANTLHDAVQKDKYLVSVMERYELFSLALNLIKNVLGRDDDEVAIRTLFRLCRKIDDYSDADCYLKHKPQVADRQGFNIQYELVYYYIKKNDEMRLLGALKYIRNSAERSIPISRTLQNFYVKLGMIDEAVELRSHLSQLTQKLDIKGKGISARDVKGVDEERETDEVFWDTIKDMVSEQEHNRQLIAIKELLRGFSHELGQPATNIRYGIQLYQMKISRGLDTKENLNELLENILLQTVRIKKLLDRFAPAVSSKSINQNFDCIASIKNVFADMKTRLAALDITFEVGGIDSFELYGDYVQFEQVMYNLISNSSDELRNKTGEKKIEVECLDHNHRLYIHFRDNGGGIPANILNKIFTPFYSTKKKEMSDGGEGLGLYIVWNILKMYGGKIRVNTDYKKGTEFLITIPGGNRNV